MLVVVYVSEISDNVFNTVISFMLLHCAHVSEICDNRYNTVFTSVVEWECVRNL